MEPSSAAQTKRNDNDPHHSGFGLYYLPFIHLSDDVVIFKQRLYRRLIENDLNKGEIGVAVAQRKP